MTTRSLHPKLDEISAVARAHCPLVIIVTESWLNEDVNFSDICLPGYSIPFRRDRVGRRGGGVCAYVSTYIRFCDVSLSAQSSLPVESLWIRLAHFKILLFAACIPPNFPKDVSEPLIQKITYEADLLIDDSTNLRLILTGDFLSLIHI